MGTHTEQTENLVADIDAMYQSRAELCSLLQKQNELRKVTVSGMLSDARDLFEKLRSEHQKRTAELRHWLGEFGGDVRKAAQMWYSRADHPTREFAEPHDKPKKKKGKQ